MVWKLAARYLPSLTKLEDCSSKKEGFRKAFYDFDIHNLVQLSDYQIAKLRENPNVIRNWLKIKVSVTNTQAFIKI